MNHATFENIQAYLRATTLEHDATAVQRPAITISREAGAGAITVGRLAAEYLESIQVGQKAPWAVFDHTLLEKVLADHGLPQTVLNYMPEDATPPLRDAVEDILGVHPSSWKLLHYTTDTILKLAHAGNVVLIGRAANVITTHMSHVLHVRLVAPIAQRIRHIASYYCIAEREATEFMHRLDKSREKYVLHNYLSLANDLLEYHLVINTGKVSYQEAAHIIGNTVLRMPIAPPRGAAREQGNTLASQG